MAEPALKKEGNLRFAGLTTAAYPDEPFALVAEVKRRLAGQNVDTYGPTTVLMALPPERTGPEAWECQVGTAVTGLARPERLMTIEDYRQLTSLSLVHHGAIRDLASTWQKLSEHANATGRRLRPYWRVWLRQRLLADGNRLPATEVSVFLDA